MGIDSERDGIETESAEFERYAGERARRKFIYEFVLRAYAGMGLVISIGGMFYFILTFLDVAITPSQQIALVAAGSGAILSFMSWLLLTYRQKREEYEIGRMRELAHSAELIEAWRRFEILSRQALREKGGDFSPHSLRYIISKLREEQKIDEEDVRTLQEALEIRNMLVHGAARLPPSAIEATIGELRKILWRLSSTEHKQSLS